MRRLFARESTTAWHSRDYSVLPTKAALAKSTIQMQMLKQMMMLQIIFRPYYTTIALTAFCYICQNLFAI